MQKAPSAGRPLDRPLEELGVASDGEQMHCDTCAQLRIFEKPACADHPRASCPDWACTGCNAAIVVAPVIMLMDRRPRVLVRRAVRRAA
jgi:hypothetical protein